MGKRIRSDGRSRLAKPIELVCLSRHGDGRPPADPTDQLTRVDGRWAWCPRGGRTAHRWRRVAAGSLNAMRDQLAELSRLVGVALAMPSESPRASGRAAPAKPKQRSLATRTKRTR